MPRMHTESHDIIVKRLLRNQFRVIADGEELGTVSRAVGPIFIGADGRGVDVESWKCSRLKDDRFSTRELAIEALFRKVHEYEPLTWELELEASIAEQRARRRRQGND